MTLSWGPTIHRVGCHELVASSLGDIFREIERGGHWEKLNPWGGCWCFRTKSGASEDLSTHAWAIAVDPRATTCRRGMRGDMPAYIVDCFEAHGWEWGGRWEPLQVCDPMHFQACTGF